MAHDMSAVAISALALLYFVALLLSMPDKQE
jgi:hypothetical protein